MSIYSDAADAIAREATRFESLAQAAIAVRKLGSLEQNAIEIQARIDRLSAEHDARMADLAARQDEAERQLRDTIQQVADATGRRHDAAAEAKRMVSAAIAQAERIILEAGIKGEAVAAFAADEADKLRTDTEAALAGVKREVADAATALGGIKAQIANRQATLDGINAHLADLKSKHAVIASSL